MGMVVGCSNISLKGTLCAVQLWMLRVGMVVGCSNNSLKGTLCTVQVMDAPCGDGGGMQ